MSSAKEALPEQSLEGRGRMSVVGVGGLTAANHDALLGALDAVRLAPGRDLTDDVHADVRGAGDALFVAQPAIVRPRLVVNADHSAGLSLRRHVDSVADCAMHGHPPVTEWLSFDLLVTGHPDVLFKGAKAAPKRSNKPP